MDYKHKRTGKLLKLAQKDIDAALIKIGLIEDKYCTFDAQRCLDEAFECLDMAKKFLSRIDIHQYEKGYVSENIV